MCANICFDSNIMLLLKSMYEKHMIFNEMLCDAKIHDAASDVINVN
jgi:hypothetical protein